MLRLKPRYLELNGTNYEIGQKIGQIVAEVPRMKAAMTSGWKQLNTREGLEARKMFDRWCPGLNEEIQGYADALGVEPLQATFYALTYLKPGCSQMVLLPSLTRNGHILLARNYEFSHRTEDFALTRTSVRGKYTHLGTSVVQMGRDEGLNQCGLAVSMSSCGFPVGAYDEMRRPALHGLQFWAVIRTLLENCRDVSQALSFMEGMPIAYNINLLLADRTGQAALVETLDGRMAVKRIDGRSRQQYLHAANHTLLPELIQYEPRVMRHSLIRYEYIRRRLDGVAGITADDLKTMLLSNYPEGLCCHYYKEFFGTTKSLVMDLDEGKIEICWGGLAQNGWRSFYVNQPLDDSRQSIGLLQGKAPPGVFDLITI